MNAIKCSIACLIIVSFCMAQNPPSVQKPVAEGSDYVVEQPGTITFKHGIVIVGKVEKPQVLIFLPKEKSYYRDIAFARSFAEDIAQPLPFDPIIE